MNVKLRTPLHTLVSSSAPLEALREALFPSCDLKGIPYGLLDRLEIAIQVALDAGKIIWDGRSSSEFNVHHKGVRDLCTTIDMNAERAILSRISEMFPKDLLLAEETSPLLGQSNNSDLHKEPVWIVDPLDGTTNFVRGHVHCATSIGFAQDGKLQLGVVYAPFLHVMYLGIRGHGAFDQEKRLRVSATDKLEKALVATGFPYDRSNIQELVDRVTVIIKHCADLRRNGAASLDLCNVANGTVDAYMETVMPWDLAAGLVIALEAGAQYANPGAAPQPAEYLDVRNLVIATPGILNDLLARMIQESAG